jgi:hypothetical protein
MLAVEVMKVILIRNHTKWRVLSVLFLYLLAFLLEHDFTIQTIGKGVHKFGDISEKSFMISPEAKCAQVRTSTTKRG